MISASDFVETARAKGFDFYAGVPCSFLRPFINYVIDDPALTYVSAANEGDAVAVASGYAISGQRSVAMMQNSGLGNAVSPLTSLNWVFRIPILLIVTWRGMPGLQDEPQHALMGQITQGMLQTMQIPWEFFPDQPLAIEAALERAMAHMDSTGRPYALVMKKGTVAEHRLQTRAGFSVQANQPIPHADFEQPRGSRRAALLALQATTARRQSVIVASTGFTGRELFALEDRPNQLYMVGSMGCASSFALGLALAYPDCQVCVADGDGAALMRMGNLATLGAYGADNLSHILLDNEVHDSTGGQATVSAGVDFARVAAACGYHSVMAGTEVSLIEQLLQQPGPRLLHLKIKPGAADDLPRPDVSPVQVRQRLQAWLNE